MPAPERKPILSDEDRAAIRQLVAASPPLTEDQKNRLADLFSKAAERQRATQVANS